MVLERVEFNCRLSTKRKLILAQIGVLQQVQHVVGVPCGKVELSAGQEAERVIRFGSIRFDSVRFGSIRFGSIRFGSVRFDSVRFGSVRFGSIGSAFEIVIVCRDL
jgi:hypothetical protein